MKGELAIKRIFLLIIPLFLFIPAIACGEDATTSERGNTTVRDEKFTQTLEDIKLGEKDTAKKEGISKDEFRLRYGGWVTAIYRNYKNIDNEMGKEDFLKASMEENMYLWFSLKYHEPYYLYFRLADSYIHRNVGTGYTGIGDDNEGPYVSAAYIQWDMKPEQNISAKWTFGRQFYYLGRGLVYADINDGAMVEVEPSAIPVYIKYLIAYTRPHQENIDFSVPGFDKNGQRLFTGGEASYMGIPNSAIYILGLYQKDLADPHPDDPVQQYGYNSYYYGGGFSTAIWKPLEFWSEVIIEQGTTFTDTTRVPLRESIIESVGWVSGVKYRVEAPTRPILEFEYAFGSGDNNRARVTNVGVGGDTDGQDHNFLYFGYYLAGYALNPRLSNLSILSLGGSFQPFMDCGYLSIFKKMAVGSKYYLYWKDESRAGTSNFQSVANSVDVGNEIDFYLHWQITDQLRTSVRYGIFYPGDAFPAPTNDNTKFFSASLTYTF